MKLSREKEKKIKSICAEVLRDIKPDYSVLDKIYRVKVRIEQRIAKLNIKGDCFIGGSIGKDTFLKGDFDCDFFLRFSKEYSEKEMNRLAKEILKPFKPNILKGSRKYFSFVKDGIYYEVVPVYRIEKNEIARNSTDYSPLHVKWVKKHSEMKDDIRLAKRFCKAHKVYGAESYRKGFSGYAVEILVIYYKGFLNFIKNGAEWGESTIIDVENKCEGVNPALILDESKLGPLILIDPVTPNRNAAAALSREKYEAFIQACRDFLEHPSKEAFVIEYLSPELIASRIHKKGLVTFIFKHIAREGGSPDKIGTRMYKEYERLLDKVRKSEFSFVKADWDWDGGKFAWSFIQFKDELLSEEKLIKGPPLAFEKHAERFRQAHGRVFEKNGRLFAIRKRDFRSPEEFINFLMRKALKYPKETVLYKVLK